MSENDERLRILIVSFEHHQKQLELLLVSHSQLNSRVGVIEANSAILIERQGEIKDLLEDRRDWLGVKKYAAKIAGLTAGLAAFVGSIYAVARAMGKS